MFPVAVSQSGRVVGEMLEAPACGGVELQQSASDQSATCFPSHHQLNPEQVGNPKQISANTSSMYQNAETRSEWSEMKRLLDEFLKGEEEFAPQSATRG